MGNFPTGISIPKSNSVILGNQENKVSFAVLYNDKSIPSSYQSGFSIGAVLPIYSKGQAINMINLQYTAHSIYTTMEADFTKSTFNEAGMNLATTLHTQIEGMVNTEGTKNKKGEKIKDGDLEIDLGMVNVNSKDGLKKISGTGVLKIALGKWMMNSSNWEFSEQGLLLKSGAIDAGVTVPFTNLCILPKEIKFGEYQLDNLTLANTLTLEIKKYNPTISFGYDKGFKVWNLSIVPNPAQAYCSEIKNLPGMGNTTFKVFSINTFSSGQFKVNILTTGQKVMINQVAQFEPEGMDLASGYVAFTGILDFQIPKFPVFESFALKYQKDNNGVIQAMPGNLNDVDFKINGVRYTFKVVKDAKGNMKNPLFSDGSLAWMGTVTDEVEGMYTFNIMKLLKTKDSTTIHETTADNTFLFSKNGKTGVHVVHASQKVIDNGSHWSNLTFEGRLFGMEGVNEAKSYTVMTVKGAVEVVPSSSSVAINNVETPFGNMSIVFDFNEKALIGSMHLDNVSLGGGEEGSAGGAALTGDIEMRLGSGSWYMFGAGEATLPDNGFVDKIKAAFFIGMVDQVYLNQKPIIKQTIQSFSYEGSYIPPMFNDNVVTGICVAGGLAIPFPPPVPTIDIPLDPFFSVSLTHGLHINAVVSVGFGDAVRLDFYANVGGFVEAHAGGSVIIGCVSATLRCDVDVNVYGGINFSSKDIYFHGETVMKLKGTVKAGGGCCDSDCDHITLCPLPCIEVNKTAIIKMTSFVDFDTNKSPKYTFSIVPDFNVEFQ
ncbi:MAG: hypothetical protein HYZ54_14860 [Ignavibacteriae bacterium]|nr:hypothetical protein [Ignavibacteriota bacterium]